MNTYRVRNLITKKFCHPKAFSCKYKPFVFMIGTKVKRIYWKGRIFICFRKIMYKVIYDIFLLVRAYILPPDQIFVFNHISFISNFLHAWMILMFIIRSGIRMLCKQYLVNHPYALKVEKIAQFFIYHDRENTSGFNFVDLFFWHFVRGWG